MSSIKQHDPSTNINNEPSMFVQRPSSGSCQDISHILNKIFRDLFTKDAVDQDTVKNLTISKSGKSGYHKKYVENLQEIQEQWEGKMKAAETIQHHLIEAESQARENEVKEHEKALEDFSDYNDLGLPSVSSHLSMHLNADLLRKYNLIVPQDFIAEEVMAPKTQESDIDIQYARPTTSSMQRYRKTPEEDNYYPDDAKLEQRVVKQKQSCNGADILILDQPEEFLPSKIDPKRKTSSGKRYKKQKEVDQKHIWRETMKPSQRMIDRNDLEKLQSKSDFLKNPRFIPPNLSNDRRQSSKATQSNENNEQTKRLDPRKIFNPIPDPVIFTDYIAGQVYEAKLLLKNVTSASRQIRAHPCSTPYFSVGLGKFPTTDGLVAPGMNCEYCITFKPDSLADYDDILKVEVNFAEPLLISLQGRRPPPELTLPDSFNCGHCLVGGVKIVEFNCQNNGGEGRFCMMSRKEWLTTNSKFPNNSPCSIRLGPFHFKPASFHLRPNDAITIEVTFSPNAVKIFKEDFILVCDNCKVKEFSIGGAGETANVEFVSVEGDLDEYQLGDIRDVLAESLITFDNQHPDTVKSKELKIQNTTAVDLPYNWLIDRPIFTKDACSELSLRENEECRKDFNERQHAFEVIPASGSLTAMEISTFHILFKPTELAEYHNVARLVLKNVPHPEFVEINAADIAAIHLELKGGSKPFDVRVQPQALNFPGINTINCFYEANFSLVNENFEAVHFDWPRMEDEMCSIVIEPNTGVIGPKETLRCSLFLSGTKPGYIRRTCICRIPRAAAPVFLQLEASFIGPVLRFNEPVLNFGLVKQPYKQQREVMLENHSNIPAIWNLKERLDNSLDEVVTLVPSSGLIEPHSIQHVIVALNPTIEAVFPEILEIEVNLGESCFLEVRSVVQHPEVCLLNSHVAIEESFVGIPVSEKITLQNLTLFDTNYRWSQIIGVDKQYSSITFTPNDGVLKPRETLEAQITIVFGKQGKINDLIAVCEIAGMEYPVLLSINAHVKGLIVEYETPDVTGNLARIGKDEKLKLEFGYNVMIGTVARTALLIKNQSAIATSFSLKAEHFHAASIPLKASNQAHDKKPETHDSKRNKRLLGKTPNLADPSSRTSEKAFRDFYNAVLADNKGVAFIPTPSQGQLGPFEHVLIEIAALSDMWGEYTDQLICKVGELEAVYFPIHLETIGCPLNFQMSKDISPILRFGTHISGGETCNRSLRINNTGPCDIRLDWESYMVESDDDQLLDLLVMIGDPFPVLNQNQQAIESLRDISEPLIKVKLNPHQGTRADRPFTIQPKQMVVPARSHSSATAHLFPTANLNSKLDIQGYALGHMSLSDKDALSNDGRTLRCDGIDLNPFHLNITGTLLPARLVVEPESENGFLFEMAASALLKVAEDSSCTVLPEAVLHRRFVISNISGTPIKFKIFANDPFQVYSNVNGKQMLNEDNDYFDLKQDSNLEVKVGLKLSLPLISSLRETANEEHKPDNSFESWVTKLDQKKPLRLQFANNTSQLYELNALIQLPVLELSQDEVQFGTCLVGQQRELDVNLRNIGRSHSYWAAEVDNGCPESSRSVFSFHPQSGFLHGDIEHGMKNSETIKVMFNARHNVEYESKLLIKGLLGERILSITLFGKGSYDELSEKLVNVLI